MDRFSRRTVKVTREHNEECRKLLGLMGIPFVVVRFPITPAPSIGVALIRYSRPRLKLKLSVLSLRAAARFTLRVQRTWTH